MSHRLFDKQFNSDNSSTGVLLTKCLELSSICQFNKKTKTKLNHHQQNKTNKKTNYSDGFEDGKNDHGPRNTKNTTLKMDKIILIKNQKG